MVANVLCRKERISRKCAIEFITRNYSSSWLELEPCKLLEQGRCVSELRDSVVGQPEIPFALRISFDAYI